MNGLRWMGLVFLVLSVPGGACRAEDSDAMRKEIRDLKAKVEALEKAPKGDIKKEVDSYLATRGAAGAEKESVTVGCGKLQLSGLLQVWYNAIQNDNEGNRSQANEAGDNDTFRIRRAEIKLSGEITPEVKWTIMFDPARAAVAGETNSEVLQDAFITFDVIKWHKVQVGQYKRPIGREGLMSSSKLPFPERAQLSRDVIMGDARDAGLMIVGEYKETCVDWFTWTFGIFNGWGNTGQGHQNRLDDNDAKDFVERLVIRLLGKQGAFCRDSEFGDLEFGFSRLDGLQGEDFLAGATLAAGWQGTAARGNREYHRYTMGFDMEYHLKIKDHGEWWLVAEYSEGTSRPISGTYSGSGLAGAALAAAVAQALDQPVRQDGWYVMTGYKIGGTGNKHVDRLEPVFRYESWANQFRPGLVTTAHPDEFRTNILEVGLNYYIKGHNAKIQAAYSFVDDPDDNDAEKRGYREVRNDQLRINFQVAF